VKLECRPDPEEVRASLDEIFPTEAEEPHEGVPQPEAPHGSDLPEHPPERIPDQTQESIGAADYEARALKVIEAVQHLLTVQHLPSARKAIDEASRLFQIVHGP
jgi:hypothetical protein